MQTKTDFLLPTDERIRKGASEVLTANVGYSPGQIVQRHLLLAAGETDYECDRWMQILRNLVTMERFGVETPIGVSPTSSRARKRVRKSTVLPPRQQVDRGCRKTNKYVFKLTIEAVGSMDCEEDSEQSEDDSEGYIDGTDDEIEELVEDESDETKTLLKVKRPVKRCRAARSSKESIGTTLHRQWVAMKCWDPALCTKKECVPARFFMLSCGFTSSFCSSVRGQVRHHNKLRAMLSMLLVRLLCGYEQGRSSCWNHRMPNVIGLLIRSVCTDGMWADFKKGCSAVADISDVKPFKWASGIAATLFLRLVEDALPAKHKGRIGEADAGTIFSSPDLFGGKRRELTSRSVKLIDALGLTWPPHKADISRTLDFVIENC